MLNGIMFRTSLCRFAKYTESQRRLALVKLGAELEPDLRPLPWNQIGIALILRLDESRGSGRKGLNILCAFLWRKSKNTLAVILKLVGLSIPLTA